MFHYFDLNSKAFVARILSILLTQVTYKSDHIYLLREVH